jgi:hypothetical protein
MTSAELRPASRKSTNDVAPRVTVPMIGEVDTSVSDTNKGMGGTKSFGKMIASCRAVAPKPPVTMTIIKSVTARYRLERRFAAFQGQG